MRIIMLNAYPHMNNKKCLISNKLYNNEYKKKIFHVIEKL